MLLILNTIKIYVAILRCYNHKQETRVAGSVQPYGPGQDRQTISC